jgi:hypothetical protein
MGSAERRRRLAMVLRSDAGGRAEKDEDVVRKVVMRNGMAGFAVWLEEEERCRGKISGEARRAARTWTKEEVKREY